MENMYQQAMTDGECVFHKDYCLFNARRHIAFDRGAIKIISLFFPVGERRNAEVQIVYANGEVYSWETKWISAYTMQFGVAVSPNGECVFAQTWENGLLCLNARTGEMIWRTKSKRGITNIFVNGDTILCHQREHALQLLDSRTGEVLCEKRPATAWGFSALDHRHIVCRVTARRWEVIDAQTLETKETFSHKVFTGGHEDYCIVDSKIILTPDGKIKVFGFKNVWDESRKPARKLPNLEFEHYVKSEVFNQD